MTDQTSPDAVQRLLEARARLLAQPLPETAPPGERLSLLVFTTGQESWALPAAAVLEIMPLRSLTAVPAAPPGVAGVVNYRGEIISVIDIGPLHGLEPRRTRDSGILIVVERAGDPQALLVDVVLGLQEIAAADLTPFPKGAATERGEYYITGVLPPATVALDLDRVLSDPRLVVDGEGSP